jgi:V8-like Glu-specific endopeptidase
MVNDGKVRPLSMGDERRHAVTNSDYPWWCVGLAKSNRGAATGVIIGRNIVLTAAHVVPWDSSDAWMTFSPGWNIPTLSFGEWPLIRARGYRVANPLEDSEHVAHDVALVQLETPLGDTLGYFGAKAYQDRWDGHGYWMSVGCPDDWQGNPECDVTDAAEDSDGEDDGLSVDTEPSLARGHSGAPFFGWFKCDDQWAPYVVGVAGSVGAQEDDARGRAAVVAGGDVLVNLIAWGRANLI